MMAESTKFGVFWLVGIHFNAAVRLNDGTRSDAKWHNS